jgi:hypothetical protein
LLDEWDRTHLATVLVLLSAQLYFFLVSTTPPLKFFVCGLHIVFRFERTIELVDEIQAATTTVTLKLSRNQHRNMEQVLQ